MKIIHEPFYMLSKDDTRKIHNLVCYTLSPYLDRTNESDKKSFNVLYHQERRLSEKTLFNSLNLLKNVEKIIEDKIVDIRNEAIQIEDKNDFTSIIVNPKDFAEHLVANYRDQLNAINEIRFILTTEIDSSDEDDD